MNKRFFAAILIFVLAVLLASCDSSASNPTDDLLDTLTGAGYVMEERDAESIAYYQANTLRTTYAVEDGVVEKLYVGYIDGTERWVEVVTLANTQQANSYAQAIYAEGATGKLLIVKNEVILITFSTETINLFPVVKGY